MAPVDALVHDERVNAILGWLLLGVVALAVVDSAVTDAVLWAGFAALIVAIAVIPPLSSGEWTVMVPWPLLLLAAVAVGARTLELYPEIAGYLAVSALALIAVIELTVFTELEMTQRFAVVFAALTTMAVQGLWMVAQFYSDRWLGTEFLRSQTELQWDIVGVSAVGFVVAGLFIWYVDRFEHVGAHGRSLPTTQER
jgi:hypothetical protein